MIKVLIADDHAILRKGLKMLLEETEDIIVVDEAADGEEVLEKLDTIDFDVLLLDINMPKKTGIEVLQEIRSSGKEIPVLILSTYSAEECGEMAMKECASGYLSKEEAPEKLIDEIRKVFQSA